MADSRVKTPEEQLKEIELLLELEDNAAPNKKQDAGNKVINAILAADAVNKASGKEGPEILDSLNDNTSELIKKILSHSAELKPIYYKKAMEKLSKVKNLGEVSFMAITDDSLSPLNQTEITSIFTRKAMDEIKIVQPEIELLVALTTCKAYLEKQTPESMINVKDLETTLLDITNKDGYAEKTIQDILATFTQTPENTVDLSVVENKITDKIKEIGSKINLDPIHAANINKLTAIKNNIAALEKNDQEIKEALENYKTTQTDDNKNALKSANYKAIDYLKKGEIDASIFDYIKRQAQASNRPLSFEEDIAKQVNELLITENTFRQNMNDFVNHFKIKINDEKIKNLLPKEEYQQLQIYLNPYNNLLDNPFKDLKEKITPENLATNMPIIKERLETALTDTIKSFSLTTKDILAFNTLALKLDELNMVSKNPILFVKEYTIQPNQRAMRYPLILDDLLKKLSKESARLKTDESKLEENRTKLEKTQELIKIIQPLAETTKNASLAINEFKRAAELADGAQKKLVNFNSKHPERKKLVNEIKATLQAIDKLPTDASPTIEKDQNRATKLTKEELKISYLKMMLNNPIVTQHLGVLKKFRQRTGFGSPHQQKTDLQPLIENMIEANEAYLKSQLGDTNLKIDVARAQTIIPTIKSEYAAIKLEEGSTLNLPDNIDNLLNFNTPEKLIDHLVQDKQNGLSPDDMIRIVKLSELINRLENSYVVAPNEAPKKETLSQESLKTEVPAPQKSPYGKAPQRAETPAPQNPYGKAPQRAESPAPQSPYGKAPQRAETPAPQDHYGKAPQRAESPAPQSPYGKAPQRAESQPLLSRSKSQRTLRLPKTRPMVSADVFRKPSQTILFTPSATETLAPVKKGGEKDTVTVTDIAGKERTILLSRISLGEGAGGIVRYATDEATQAPLAFKRTRLPDKPTQDDYESYERGQREVQLHKYTLSKIDPLKDVLAHVIAGAEGATTGGKKTVYQFMEYMAYGNLKDFSKRIRENSSLSEEEKTLLLLYITDSVFKDITALHDAGIIHRDLKSANFLVHADGSIKAADFGGAYSIKNDFEVSNATDVRYQPPYYYTNGKIKEKVTIDDQLKGDGWALGLTLREIWGDDLSQYFSNVYYSNFDLSKIKSDSNNPLSSLGKTISEPLLQNNEHVGIAYAAFKADHAQDLEKLYVYEHGVPKINKELIQSILQKMPPEKPTKTAPEKAPKAKPIKISFDTIKNKIGELKKRISDRRAKAQETKESKIALKKTLRTLQAKIKNGENVHIQLLKLLTHENYGALIQQDRTLANLYSELNDQSASLMTNTLTRLDKEFYESFNPYELFQTPDAQPTLEKATEFYNNTLTYFISNILNKKLLAERTAEINFLLKVAEKALDDPIQPNVNLASCIHSAIHEFSTSRLEATFAGLSLEAKNTKARLEKLFSRDKNYSALKAFYEQHPNCIPNLANIRTYVSNIKEMHGIKGYRTAYTPSYDLLKGQYDRIQRVKHTEFNPVIIKSLSETIQNQENKNALEKKWKARSFMLEPEVNKEKDEKPLAPSTIFSKKTFFAKKKTPSKKSKRQKLAKTVPVEKELNLVILPPSSMLKLAYVNIFNQHANHLVEFSTVTQPEDIKQFLEKFNRENPMTPVEEKNVILLDKYAERLFFNDSQLTLPGQTTLNQSADKKVFATFYKMLTDKDFFSLPNYYSKQDEAQWKLDHPAEEQKGRSKKTAEETREYNNYKRNIIHRNINDEFNKTHPDADPSTLNDLVNAEYLRYMEIENRLELAKCFINELPKSDVADFFQMIHEPHPTLEKTIADSLPPSITEHFILTTKEKLGKLPKVKLPEPEPELAPKVAKPVEQPKPVPEVAAPESSVPHPAKEPSVGKLPFSLFGKTAPSKTAAAKEKSVSNEELDEYKKWMSQLDDILTPASEPKNVKVSATDFTNINTLLKGVISILETKLNIQPTQEALDVYKKTGKISESVDTTPRFITRR